MEIYCCGCQEKVKARLTNGEEIYPHRGDLYSLPFWKCDECGNHVGCHHKNNSTKPLGCIPTKKLKDARMYIHSILDPIWKSGKLSRKELYHKISQKLGYEYHTAQIKSIQESKEVQKIIKALI